MNKIGKQDSDKAGAMGIRLGTMGQIRGNKIVNQEANKTGGGGIKYETEWWIRQEPEG